MSPQFWARPCGTAIDVCYILLSPGESRLRRCRWRCRLIAVAVTVSCAALIRNEGLVISPAHTSLIHHAPIAVRTANLGETWSYLHRDMRARRRRRIALHHGARGC
jgi:hypothetical protein